ncbi:MAG: DMT family transporter, partial [Oscillospiraceae bacterium]|nr:DMT family transporter [Oscillospiraceae bacterium]
SAVVLLPYVLLTEDVSALTFDGASVGLLLLIGVLHTGVAYALYFSSISALPAQTVGLLGYIDPVIAVLLSALLLHEPLGISGAAGTLLILGAAVVSEREES